MEYVLRPRGANGFGISALVLAILSLLICWIPFIGVFGIPLAAIGLLLAIVGVLVAVINQRSTARLSVIAGVCCMLSIVLSITITRFVAHSLSKAMADIQADSQARIAASTHQGQPATAEASSQP